MILLAIVSAILVLGVVALRMGAAMAAASGQVDAVLLSLECGDALPGEELTKSAYARAA